MFVSCISALILLQMLFFQLLFTCKVCSYGELWGKLLNLHCCLSQLESKSTENESVCFTNMQQKVWSGIIFLSDPHRCHHAHIVTSLYLAGSSSTLFWAFFYICCGFHLAALVLDDLQCRSCVFSLHCRHSYTMVPAAESHGIVHHARCSPEDSCHLPGTSFGLCSSNDPSQLQTAGK